MNKIKLLKIMKQKMLIIIDYHQYQLKQLKEEVNKIDKEIIKINNKNRRN